MAPETILNERDTATLLGLTARALQSWRMRGYGPPFVRISSRCVRYRREDLDAWLAARVVRSTSEPTPADADGGAR